MARVGKFAPVLKWGKLATVRSTQSRPLGSLTLVMAGPNATEKQRPIRILLSDASSWMTYTCLTADTSVDCPLWSVFVATGLTSSFPMIPSLHVPTPLTLFPGPNWIPAVLESAPVTGERHMVRTLLAKPETGHWRAPDPIWSATR